ncbi:hypothetical protein FDECE_12063 [Fusarium decemcellulare]|nr:hypothetical protein FDECE_12063 [Fusarium decemcellulare]
MATPWTQTSIDEDITEREHNGVYARQRADKEDSVVAVKGLLVDKGSVGAEQKASGKLLDYVTENDNDSAKKGREERGEEELEKERLLVPFLHSRLFEGHNGNDAFSLPIYVVDAKHGLRFVDAYSQRDRSRSATSETWGRRTW